MKVSIVLPSELDQLQRIAIETYIDTFASSNTEENMEIFLKETYNMAQLEKELAEPDSFYYMAWEENIPVGYARIRKSDEAEKELGKNTLELQRLYILPAFKGKKAGSSLMKEVIRYAQEKKIEWLWLGVWERNFAAQKFYERWGFEKFGEHIFQMGDDPQIDWMMRRSVAVL